MKRPGVWPAGRWDRPGPTASVRPPLTRRPSGAVPSAPSPASGGPVMTFGPSRDPRNPLHLEVSPTAFNPSVPVRSPGEVPSPRLWVSGCGRLWGAVTLTVGQLGAKASPPQKRSHRDDTQGTGLGGQTRAGREEPGCPFVRGRQSACRVLRGARPGRCAVGTRWSLAGFWPERAPKAAACGEKCEGGGLARTLAALGSVPTSPSATLRTLGSVLGVVTALVSTTVSCR